MLLDCKPALSTIAAHATLLMTRSGFGIEKMALEVVPTSSSSVNQQAAAFGAGCREDQIFDPRRSADPERCPAVADVKSHFRRH